MNIRITVRFTEEIAMRVRELSSLYKKSISTVVKALLLNSLNSIIDDSGNLLISPQKSVLETIAKNYDRLRDECITGNNMNYSGMTEEDMFNDTILLMSRDEKAFEMNENQIIERFKYRYNMIKFRAIQNTKQKREISFADNIQAKKEED